MYNLHGDSSKVLKTFLIVNLFVLIIWIVYLLKLIITQIVRYFKISQNKFPVINDYEEQYRVKVDILKYAFLICCFACELLSEFFGFLTGHLASHDDHKPNNPIHLSPTCELIPFGWLYRIYRNHVSFVVCQALWYCYTILALSLFTWMLHIQIRAYSKALNQVRYVLPSILLLFAVGAIFVLSTVEKTAVFGSVTYCILVLLIYVVAVYKVIRFGKILRQIRNESSLNAKDSFRKVFYNNKLSFDEKNFKKYGVLVALILFFLGLDLCSQFVYNCFNVLVSSILINPCWFNHVYKINFHIKLSNATIQHVTHSAYYLTVARNITSSCYILGFICLSVGIVFIPKLFSIFRTCCKKENPEFQVSGELEEKLIK